MVQEQLCDIVTRCCHNLVLCVLSSRKYH